MVWRSLAMGRARRASAEPVAAATGGDQPRFTCFPGAVSTWGVSAARPRHDVIEPGHQAQRRRHPLITFPPPRIGVATQVRGGAVIEAQLLIRGLLANDVGVRSLSGRSALLLSPRPSRPIFRWDEKGLRVEPQPVVAGTRSSHVR